MVSRERRMSDFKTLREKLDITTTMHADAVDKYTTLGNFLNSQGISCEIYPQGSFSLGTVVRPYNKEEEPAYDLDFICNIDFEKSEKTPKEIKEIIGNILKSNETYRKRLDKEYDKCWTIKYSGVDENGFNIDIVPSVKEENIIISQLSIPTEFSEGVVAITNKDGIENYSWKTANPKGYKKWFDGINEPFLKFAETREAQFMCESKDFNKTVEKIPKQKILSALQKAIQILKRNRDVYFYKLNINNKSEIEKPISAMITTLCALIAEKAPKDLDEIDLLQFIIMNIGEESKFLSDSNVKLNFLKNINGKWILENPVNPADNLADSWNCGEQKNVNAFFKWIKTLKNEVIDSFEQDDKTFYLALESYAGANFVQKNISPETYSQKVAKLLETESIPWSN